MNHGFGCVCNDVQERPVDIVVDGFIHLQQYHVGEIARGLAGVGSYRLKYDHLVSAAVHSASDFVIAPADIVMSVAATNRREETTAAK